MPADSLAPPQLTTKANPRQGFCSLGRQPHEAAWKWWSEREGWKARDSEIMKRWILQGPPWETPCFSLRGEEEGVTHLPNADRHWVRTAPPGPHAAQQALRPEDSCRSHWVWGTAGSSKLELQVQTAYATSAMPALWKWSFKPLQSSFIR